MAVRFQHLFTFPDHERIDYLFFTKVIIFSLKLLYFIRKLRENLRIYTTQITLIAFNWVVHHLLCRFLRKTNRNYEKLVAQKKKLLVARVQNQIRCTHNSNKLSRRLVRNVALSWSQNSTQWRFWKFFENYIASQRRTINVINEHKSVLRRQNETFFIYRIVSFNSMGVLQIYRFLVFGRL